MDVSENSGTPKSSILIGFSIINNPFWGTPIFGNTHMIRSQVTIFHEAVSEWKGHVFTHSPGPIKGTFARQAYKLNWLRGYVGVV